MKALLEVIGFLALAQGVMGLLDELFADWDIGLVRRIGFLDGVEIYASITLVVLACALFAVAERRKPD
ncbi:hypothetical protein IAG44_07935 [Streptomyces roseirectus]|uniref:Uncharacterized protein n=1 Tax=Streptomyces roseirectus TaxID=2768066 RepID=A0A7H0I9A6_9ACTN|nr:hypothetical protein [Streptomyces roseirectus]QNP69372.1 hypothetical protein IAG44_07935 [Streptomyces roseirectus]